MPADPLMATMPPTSTPSPVSPSPESEDNGDHDRDFQRDFQPDPARSPTPLPRDSPRDAPIDLSLRCEDEQDGDADVDGDKRVQTLPGADSGDEGDDEEDAECETGVRRRRKGKRFKVSRTSSSSRSSKGPAGAQDENSHYEYEDRDSADESLSLSLSPNRPLDLKTNKRRRSSFADEPQDLSMKQNNDFQEVSHILNGFRTRVRPQTHSNLRHLKRERLEETVNNIRRCSIGTSTHHPNHRRPHRSVSCSSLVGGGSAAGAGPVDSLLLRLSQPTIAATAAGGLWALRRGGGGGSEVDLRDNSNGGAGGGVGKNITITGGDDGDLSWRPEDIFFLGENGGRGEKRKSVLSPAELDMHLRKRQALSAAAPGSSGQALMQRMLQQLGYLQPWMNASYYEQLIQLQRTHLLRAGHEEEDRIAAEMDGKAGSPEENSSHNNSGESGKGSAADGNGSRRSRAPRVLTGKHVKQGTGASPSTLLTLRQTLEQRRRVKEVVGSSSSLARGASGRKKPSASASS